MTVGFDTNLFIYSFDRTDPARHAKAGLLLNALLDRSPAVPMQIISEALSAAHKKRHLSVSLARTACEALADLVRIEPATAEDAVTASRLAEAHKLQFFDAQMVVTQARLGVTLLLSEDMQDGRRLAGLQIADPFNPANDHLMSPLLTPPS